MWYFKKIQWMLPIRRIRSNESLSEREFARLAQVSRLTLRASEKKNSSISVQSLTQIVSHQERDLILLESMRGEIVSELSTAVVSMKVRQDGFESWKTHFFEMIDEFRRTWDPQLILLPPVRTLDLKLQGLLASIVLSLCEEANIDHPRWSIQPYYLDQPWFPSESDALKATALVESPVWFRKNNIFVLDNFLSRA